MTNLGANVAGSNPAEDEPERVLYCAVGRAATASPRSSSARASSSDARWTRPAADVRLAWRKAAKKLGGNPKDPRSLQSRAVAAGVRQGPDGVATTVRTTVGTQGRGWGQSAPRTGRGRGREGGARGRRAESRASRIGPTRVRRSRPRRAQGVRHSLRSPPSPSGRPPHRRRRRFGRTGFVRASLADAGGRCGCRWRRRPSGRHASGWTRGSIPPPAGQRRTGRRVDGASFNSRSAVQPFDSSGASRASRPHRGDAHAPLERTSCVGDWQEMLAWRSERDEGDRRGRRHPRGHPERKEEASRVVVRGAGDERSPRRPVARGRVERVVLGDARASATTAAIADAIRRRPGWFPARLAASTVAAAAGLAAFSLRKNSGRRSRRG